MTNLFVALTLDDTPRMFGYENGAGHALLIPAGVLNDPLAVGGTIGTVCGGKGVDSQRLTEKFTGDKLCARCVKWLASDGGRNDVEVARQAKYAQYTEGVEGGPELGADVAPVVREITREDVRDAVRKSKGEQVRERRAVAVAAERSRLATRAAGACGGTSLPPVPGTRVQRDDHSVSLPDDYNGKHSGKCPGEGCGRIIAVSREGGMRRHNAPAVREASAPTLPGMDETTGVTGLTHAEMRDAVATFYANGGKPSPEILALPAPGTVQWSGTDAGDSGTVTPCDFKGDVEIINPERTHGKCPECNAYIALQDVESDPDANRIGQHNRYGVATPAGAGLSSKSMDNVEHGSAPGDPESADKRRAAESRCVKSNKISKSEDGGTVPCPECARPVELVKKISQTKKGTKIKWIIPNHVRPGDSFRRAGADGKGERKVTPRGTGADAGKGQRGHGSVDGAATTGSQNMAPVRPGGWVGKAGTMSLPATVRPGIDPEVSGKLCPLCQELPEIAHKGMTRSARRRHSARVGAVLRERAQQRETRKAAEIAEGIRITGAERRELRKAASVGSFAEGNVGGMVSHETRPEFAPKGERKPAAWRAGKTTRETARKALAGTARKSGK